MALALKKSDDTDEGGKTGYSLRERLHAWWEGYELGSPPESGADNAVPDTAAFGDSANDSDDAAAGVPVNEAPIWSESRQKLIEVVWGEGFSTPGGGQRVLDLAQPFGLTAENTMLEIGSGPGGGACAVAEKIGSYVEGFDLNNEMAKKSLEISLIKGLDQKTRVKQFDPEKFVLKKNFFDGCLIRETLIAIEEKDAFLDVVLEALKPTKPIVIAEMFLAEPEPGELASASLNSEFGDVFPCTVDGVVKKIKESGFKVRTKSDETDAYIAMAREAWADVAGRISEDNVADELADALVRETALWERRIAAFEAGELSMYRIVAFKNSAEIR